MEDEEFFNIRSGAEYVEERWKKGRRKFYLLA